MAKLLAERAERAAADLAYVLTELRPASWPRSTPRPRPNSSSGPRPSASSSSANRDDLRRRAAAVPAEIERETAAIRARYTDPQPRMFPVAVTYRVPERLARA